MIGEGTGAMAARYAGAALLWLWAAQAVAGPVSIGFDGPGEGAAPPEWSEDGFRIVTRDAMISCPGKSGDGTDGPNEIEAAMGTRGAVAILRAAPFALVSLDWQSESGAPGITVEGYLGPHLVARERHVAPGPEAGFVTFGAGALAGQAIDRLILYPQRGSGGMGALDRVVLDAPAEPPETS